MKKIMLDIHGVIDRNPELFVSIANILRKTDGEVHIVTGEHLSEKLISQLKSYNKKKPFWDYLISIQDELAKKKSKILKINEYERPIFLDEEWDSFKGNYCREKNIDLAIDDSPEYKKYFETPIIICPKNEELKIFEIIAAIEALGI